MTKNLLDIRNRKVALIGGAGFIGHNLALELKAQGAEVEVIDSLQVNNLIHFTSAVSDPNRDLYLYMLNQRLDLMNKAHIPLHIQDARDYHALSRILLKINPEVIVHLAAVSHAGNSNKDPYSTFDHSLRTLENALDFTRGQNVQHFIYLSSSMVYGNFLTPEVTEESPLNSLGIYGALKVAGERMVVAYNQVFDLPYTIIRPSALYGYRCVSRRVGQIFIESAMKGESLRVDGDGSERLDFTFIDDLVGGIIQAIRHTASRNQTFNMTYGESRSLNDLAKTVQKEFPNIAIQYVERDRLMPFRGTLNIDKAKNLIGYAPLNPIEKGFKKYIDWYKSLDRSGKLWVRK